ncbi:MAG: CoxG family protein, partial [Pseudomonadales bacterium]
LNPPLSYVIKGEGKGGVAGFAKGSATVSLATIASEQGEATRLTYSVEASVGGKIAQLGGRLIQGAARKMAQDFFTKFVQALCEDETLVPEIETVSAP